MSFFRIEHLKAVCAGQYLSRGGAGATEQIADGVSIDSRSILPGQVFVALAGERFDGHKFVAEVAAAGAAAILVQHDVPGAAELPVPVIKVESTRKSLVRLAAAYRKTLRETKVIAVCGSNGKSTTVRLIETTLATKLRGTASRKSHNNDIGVPLTILAAKPTDQYLICEVGTNHPGEIAALGSVVEPDIAVITSIGREHLEFFGDVAGVAREEASILPCIRAGGLAVVTADSPELLPLLKPAPSVIRFGLAAQAELRLTAFEYVWDAAGNPVAWFSCSDRLNLHMALPGRHNACNALAAVAVGRRLGLDDATIAGALATARGPEMRWQAERIVLHGHKAAGGTVLLINDAYNANPDSLAASLATFAELFGPAMATAGVGGAAAGVNRAAAIRRRVLVLGDMLELGATSDAAHDDAGRLVAKCGCIDVLVAVGPAAQRAAASAMAVWGSQHAAKIVRIIEPTDAAVAGIAGLMNPGDVVLLKGSRGMRLERVTKALKSGAVVNVKLDAVRQVAAS